MRILFFWIMLSMQVIKMLMMVVALFTLAWLPLQLYDVLNQIFTEINEYNSTFPCHHIIIISSARHHHIFTLAWLPLQLYDVLNQIFTEINQYN